MFCLILNVEDEADDMHVQKKDKIESWTEEKDDVIKFEDQGSVKEKLHLALMVCRLLMDGVLPVDMFRVALQKFLASEGHRN